MNWKEFISNLKVEDSPISYDFNLPATNLDLESFRIDLKLNELPSELEELYKQTNGVNEYMQFENVGKQKIGELIYSIKCVIQANNEVRNNPSFKNLLMSFDELLFFADAGNGDLFGFVTLLGNFNRNDIFVWNHEDDSRIWVAPNLMKFIEWWTNGTIGIK
jgi:SMI1-KNR4 cell-wall